MVTAVYIGKIVCCKRFGRSTEGYCERKGIVAKNELMYIVVGGR